MKKCNLVTITQALILKDLGFDDPTTTYCWTFSERKFMSKCMYSGAPMKWNHYAKEHGNNHLAMPTVDEAIDWLRIKYSVMVGNSVLPFVDPKHGGKIVYLFSVKKCYSKGGYNYRELIGRTTLSHNCYSAKRMAITLALKWLLKNRNAKIIKMQKQ